MVVGDNRTRRRRFIVPTTSVSEPTISTRIPIIGWEQPKSTFTQIAPQRFSLLWRERWQWRRRWSGGRQFGQYTRRQGRRQPKFWQWGCATSKFKATHRCCKLDTATKWKWERWRFTWNPTGPGPPTVSAASIPCPDAVVHESRS